MTKKVIICKYGFLFNFRRWGGAHSHLARKKGKGLKENTTPEKRYRLVSKITHESLINLLDNLCLGLQGFERINRGPAILDELGPGVGEDEVFDARLCVLEDGRVELFGNLTPVVNTVSDAIRYALLGARGDGGRRRLKGELVEGADRVSLTLLAVKKTSGPFENILEFLEVTR